MTPSTPSDQGDDVVQLPGRECRCVGDGVSFADTTACPVHTTETSPLAQGVQATYDEGLQQAIRDELDWTRAALRAIRGPEDSGPFIEVYRAAGGGYEGLQAMARLGLREEL